MPRPLLTIVLLLTFALPAMADDWGPLTGPWVRESRPIITATNVEESGGEIGIQCGTNLLQFQDKYWMLLLTPTRRFGYTTKVAVSDDGLEWRRESYAPLLQRKYKWEGPYNLAKTWIRQGDRVLIYYFGKLGIEERIGLAVTADMKTVEKREEGPIVTVRDVKLDGERIFPGSVVKDGETFYLFYTIGYGYHHPEHPRHYVIGLATSTDGVNFADADQNPQLGHGRDGAWDDKHVCQPSVLRIGDWWYMMYTGASRKQPGKDGQSFGLARARKPTGPWERYPRNPIMQPRGDSWDNKLLQHACPEKVDGRWVLYYTGNSGRRYAIGRAIRAE